LCHFATAALAVGISHFIAFSFGVQDFYQSKGFTSRPSRCADCRAAIKDAQADQQQAAAAATATASGGGGTNVGGGGSESGGGAAAVAWAAAPLAPALAAFAVQGLLRRLGVARVANVRVPHCREAFGVRIDGLPRAPGGGGGGGWSVCYSGDCRPSAALAELGRGATVCVHEASFGDDMQARSRESERARERGSAKEGY
jgi:hypothetical protein